MTRCSSADPTQPQGSRGRCAEDTTRGYEALDQTLSGIARIRTEPPAPRRRERARGSAAPPPRDILAGDNTRCSGVRARVGTRARAGFPGSALSGHPHTSSSGRPRLEVLARPFAILVRSAAWATRAKVRPRGECLASVDGRQTRIRPGGKAPERAFAAKNGGEGFEPSMNEKTPKTVFEASTGWSERA